MRGLNRKLLNGPKISNSHSTVIEAAVPLVRAAKRLVEVEKIVIGEIAFVGPGRKRIRMCDVPAGLKIVVRGGLDRQILFIYTSAQRLVQQYIEAAWERIAA